MVYCDSGIRLNHSCGETRLEQIELAATRRETLGKAVRFLRRQGITPVHLFGRGVDSLALQCDTVHLRKALARAGQTRLISLKLEDEKRPRSVVVRGVQTGPVRGELLHVDFFEVRMEERVKVETPIVLTGEAPVLKLREYMLVQELDTLTVECLPGQIPTGAGLDLSSLSQPEQTLRVSDTGLGKEIAVLDDPEQVVVRIVFRPVEKPVEKIQEPAVVEEAVETPEAASPEEGKPEGT